MIRRLLPALAVFLVLTAGCRSEPSERTATRSATPPRTLILVSLDTVRSDRLPSYGYAAGETPVLDRLAEEGILYERAYSPAPLTAPAHGSLFTGRLPAGHGIRDNAGYRLRDVETVAEALRGVGYRTGAFVSSFVLRRDVGLDRGFEIWDDELPRAPQATIAEIQRAGPETMERAFQWLRERGDDERIFLFVHLYDPHAPYTPPEPYRSRLDDPYDGEIALVDAVVGDLVAELRDAGRYDESAIVVLSDHGEGLGDHGEDEHGVLLYREALQVPLVVKLPGGERAGERVSRPVDLTDVAPTLLELAEAPPLPSAEGVSLLSTSEDEDGEAVERPLYAETFHPRIRFGWSELTSVIRGPWHYIHGPDPELYHLEEDPGETRNLVAEHRRVYSDLRAALEGFDSSLEEPFETDEATRQTLASLGYLSGGGDSGPDRDRPDPKAKLGTLEPLRQGIRALQEGDAARAEGLLVRAVAANEESVDGWQFLGMARNRLGKTAASFEAYERAFQLSNGSPVLAEPLARLALSLGRTEDALAFLDLASEEEPHDSELGLLHVRALLVEGQPEEAVGRSNELLERFPGSPEALHFRGAARMSLGDLESAENDLRAAIREQPRYVPALSDLAVLLASQGRSDEARDVAARILAIHPEHPGARSLLARLGMESGHGSGS